MVKQRQARLLKLCEALVATLQHEGVQNHEVRLQLDELFRAERVFKISPVSGSLAMAG